MSTRKFFVNINDVDHVLSFPISANLNSLLQKLYVLTGKWITCSDMSIRNAKNEYIGPLNESFTVETCILEDYWSIYISNFEKEDEGDVNDRYKMPIDQYLKREDNAAKFVASQRNCNKVYEEINLYPNDIVYTMNEIGECEPGSVAKAVKVAHSDQYDVYLSRNNKVEKWNYKDILREPCLSLWDQFTQ